jgi:Mce-associated membrane protein
MAESSRPRRVVGSRNPTGRPRKIASQTHSVEEPVDGPEPPQHGTPAVTESVGAASRDNLRTTIALLVATVVLLGLGIAELVYLNNDADATVSASRPVVVGDATRGEAVETAARSTEEILSTTYQDYDDQVQQATDKMTGTFAEQYQQTSDGIRDRFIDQKTQLQVKAVGQSVVQASPTQVQALLFLNQYVQKVVDGQAKTDFAQYRALVTVVHTDHGWLVSNIDTK